MSQGGAVAERLKFLRHDGEFQQERAPLTDVLRFVMLRAVDWETDPDEPRFRTTATFTGSVTATQTPSVVLATVVKPLVSAATLTTIVTLSPVVDTFVSTIFCSGDQSAKFQLFVNSGLIITQRSGPSLNANFPFRSNPLKLVGSLDILDLKVTHNVTGQTPDFESTIMGFV